MRIIKVLTGTHTPQHCRVIATWHAGATLIVTDGVNLIEVRGSGVGREDLLAAAERITTAVSGA